MSLLIDPRAGLGLLASLLCVGGPAGAQGHVQRAWQLALLEMDHGDTLHLPAGEFTLTESLIVDGLDDIVIAGAGRGETILRFGDQVNGAEGLRVSNCDRVTLRDFAIFDTAGDAIKAQACGGITFAHVETSWSGKPDEGNGSYGLYPVQCTDVLIEGCRARGASDAGIYVGQSERVVVRDCEAIENVAGIEIENTSDAEVYGNVATGNTGGILVFDLPGLIKKAGGRVWVHDNEVRDNQLRNFAPAGNIVGQVPPGTGVMVLATSDVVISDNVISGHKTASVAVVSYHVAELPIEDDAYDPIPTGVVVRDNRISRKRQWPALKPRLGKLLALKYGRRVPPILYDGITAETLAGDEPDSWGLCISGDQGDLAFLDAARGFDGLSRDPDGFACDLEELSDLTPVRPQTDR